MLKMPDATAEEKTTPTCLTDLENRIRVLEETLRQEKQIRGALRQSEERFRGLFEVSPWPSLLIQGERVKDGNTAALDSLGLREKSNLVSSSLRDLFPERPPEGRFSGGAFAEYVDRARREGPLRFEWTLLSPDGHPLLVDMVLTPLPSETSPRLQATWRDIPPPTKPEMGFPEDQRTFRAIFDNTFQFTGLMTPDGILTEANKTALDFAGASLEEVKNKPFWETPGGGTRLKSGNSSAIPSFGRRQVNRPGIFWHQGS